MKDRDLAATVVARALQRLGCEASVQGSWFKAVRRAPGGILIAKQHLHKGERDIVRRDAVRKIYRHRLQFTPEEFYAAVDAVK